MCDYSLMAYESRLAEEGDDLELFRFSCGVNGLVKASRESLRGLWGVVRKIWNPDPISPVVCVPPGARLLLYNIPAVVQEARQCGSFEEVTFEQLHAEVGDFRDSIRFNNGEVVSLQRLPVGVRVKVLSVSVPEEVTESSRDARFPLLAGNRPQAFGELPTRPDSFF